MNDFEIKPGTVHLWCLSLHEFQEDSFRSILNSDEIERADRFHFPQHRERFTIARGLLRHILGCYTNQLAQDIQFKYGLRGKPYLENNSQEIQFNLSHSEQVAVLAVTNSHEIGVDIEKVKANYNDGVAKRFFSQLEHEAILALPIEEQAPAFYQLWACKEALIKTLGEGLYQSLSDFTVSLQHSSQWVSLLYHQQPKSFYLEMFQSFPTFRSAFATDRKVEEVIYKKWPAN